MAVGVPFSEGAEVIYLPADQDLSGHRVVVMTSTGVSYADPMVGAHADAVVGVTRGAALAGEMASVQIAGEMEELSWAWTPGQPLYCGANGFLTHTPPSSGWVQIVAVALTANRILLSGRQAILR